MEAHSCTHNEKDQHCKMLELENAKLVASKLDMI